jgi:hypothetical protein
MLGSAALGIAVPFADALADVDKIQVSIDLHDMDRPVVLEGPYAGNVHCVVAAQDDYFSPCASR